MLMTKAVIKKVQTDFPVDAQATVLDYLSLYGARESEEDVERVRLAILKRASGEVEKILELVGEAKQDHSSFLA